MKLRAKSIDSDHRRHVLRARRGRTNSAGGGMRWLCGAIGCCTA